MLQEGIKRWEGRLAKTEESNGEIQYGLIRVKSEEKEVYITLINSLLKHITTLSAGHNCYWDGPHSDIFFPWFILHLYWAMPSIAWTSARATGQLKTPCAGYYPEAFCLCSLIKWAVLYCMWFFHTSQRKKKRGSGEVRVRPQSPSHVKRGQ